MVSPEQPSPAEAQEIREIEWTPYAELHLINSLGGLKAIGINHHFCMAIAWHRFTSAMHMNVSAEALRKRLETFYDFANAEKLVGEIPFPNDEVEFSLPEDEFPGLRLETQAAAAAEEKPQTGKKEVAAVSGKRFSSPIIPKSRTPFSDARKDRSSFSSKESKQRSSSPSLHGNAAGATPRKDARRGAAAAALAAEDQPKRKSAEKREPISSATPPSSTTSSSSSTAATSSTAPSAAASASLQKKLYKESRVVLTKGRSFDELLMKRGIRADEEKKTPLGTGKKRQSRMSDAKPGSPTPTKRARH